MRIGMIGLGAMGLPIAKRLLGAGHELCAFDLSPRAAGEAEAAGARICPTAGEARRGYRGAFLLAAKRGDRPVGARGNPRAGVDRRVGHRRPEQHRARIGAEIFRDGRGAWDHLHGLPGERRGRRRGPPER